MNRKIPLFLLPVMIALAAYLFMQQQERVFGDKGRLSVAQEGQAVVLSWSSGVEIPMALRFSEAIAEWAPKTQHFIINLNSEGGSLREGRLVIEQLEALKQSHRVDTRVGFRQYCLSMCVPIYLRGNERYASARSIWMFHEPRAVNFFTEEEEDIPRSEQQALADRFFERYFTNSDMDPVWRESLRKQWVGKDIWKSGQDLVDENANVVTQLR